MVHIEYEAAGLLEAPRPGPEGTVVFANVTAGGVYALRDGSVQTVLPTRRGIGGIARHVDGGLVVTGRDVAYCGPGGVRTVVDVPGATGFNDVTVAPDGSLLVGVLRHRPARGEPAGPSEVVRIDERGAVTPVVTDLLWPNGIGYGPDGQTIYVSEYAASRVRVVRGGESEVFAAAPRGECDGLAGDVEGGVWVALGSGGGVARFAADGRLDTVLDLPDRFVSSVAFAGTTLIVTTIGAVLSQPVGIAGLPIPAARIPLRAVNGQAGIGGSFST